MKDPILRITEAPDQAFIIPNIQLVEIEETFDTWEVFIDGEVCIATPSEDEARKLYECTLIQIGEYYAN